MGDDDVWASSWYQNRSNRSSDRYSPQSFVNDDQLIAIPTPWSLTTMPKLRLCLPAEIRRNGEASHVFSINEGFGIEKVLTNSSCIQAVRCVQ